MNEGFYLGKYRLGIGGVERAYFVIPQPVVQLPRLRFYVQRGHGWVRRKRGKK